MFCGASILKKHVMKTYHYIAIGIAAIASFVLDFIWFAILFASPYLEDLGRTKAQLDQGPDETTAFMIQIIANIIIATVLTWLINKLNYQTIGQSLQLAVLVWLAFIVCV